MEYNPKKFSGEHAQEIYSAVVASNRTVANNVIRFLPNIKNEQHVTSISGDVPFVGYQEKIRETDIDAFHAQSTLKLADRTISPVKILAFDTFTTDNLRNSRFGAGMAPGAKNIGSTEFEKAVTDYLIPRLGKSYEKLMWTGITAAAKTAIAASSTATTAQKAWAAAQTAGLVNGLIAASILAGDDPAANGAMVKTVVGTTINTSNIATEYGKIFAALPGEVIEEGNAGIVAPLSDLQTILAANVAQTYRDIFTVSGTGADMKVSYLTIPIEFAPLGSARMAGKLGATSNLIAGTDLLGDVNSFEINKVNNVGDEIFGKMVATLDTTILVPEQYVLYV
jgi:hypothetical protein